MALFQNESIVNTHSNVPTFQIHAGVGDLKSESDSGKTSEVRGMIIDCYAVRSQSKRKGGPEAITLM